MERLVGQVKDMGSAPAMASFDDAVARFEQSLSCDGPDIDPRCCSQLLHHGRPTARVLVLFHGFTNCPVQWSIAAERAHARGVTVLCPRAPGHGRADRRPDDLTDLSADTLSEWVADSVGIASQLGGQVTVAGFSFGGVCAGWAARHLDSVDEVLLLAPAYLPFGYPVPTAALLPAATKILPERYMWWDPVRKGAGATSPHVYPKLSRRGIGAVFELGQEARKDAARRTAPLDHAALVLNATDLAINPRAARLAFEEGIAPHASRTTVHTFPASERYPHDLIDPAGLNSHRAEQVNEQLLGLLGM
jgi:pimeloyl-ACP methyl ester carboxylesterase